MEEYLGSDHLTTEEVGRFGQFKNFFPYSSKRQISSFQIFQPPPPPPSQKPNGPPLIFVGRCISTWKRRAKNPALFNGTRRTSRSVRHLSQLRPECGGCLNFVSWYNRYSLQLFDSFAGSFWTLESKERFQHVFGMEGQE